MSITTTVRYNSRWSLLLKGIETVISHSTWFGCCPSEVKTLTLKLNEWMNEFLEQLVRVLTNAYSRSQKKFGERVSPGPTNQRSFLCLPCCWGTIAIKASSLDPTGLSMLCLFPYQRVFYALASCCPSRRTNDCF